MKLSAEHSDSLEGHIILARVLQYVLYIHVRYISAERIYRICTYLRMKSPRNDWRRVGERGFTLFSQLFFFSSRIPTYRNNGIPVKISGNILGVMESLDLRTRVKIVP